LGQIREGAKGRFPLIEQHRAGDASALKKFDDFFLYQGTVGLGQDRMKCWYNRRVDE